MYVSHAALHAPELGLNCERRQNRRVGVRVLEQIREMVHPELELGLDALGHVHPRR